MEFDEWKLIILRLLFSESNEKVTKSLVKKLVIFTNNKCKFNIVWNTRNIRLLFQSKDNDEHYSCVIYEGNCSFGENYVGESVRNVVLRWFEYEDPNKQSEPAKHLEIFSWPSIWMEGAEAKLFTRYSLLFTRYFLFVTP